MKAIVESMDIIMQDIKTSCPEGYNDNLKDVKVAFEGDGILMYYDGVYENDYGEVVICMSTNAPFDDVTIEDIKSDIVAVYGNYYPEDYKIVFELDINKNCECAGYDGVYWDDINNCIRVCASTGEIEEESEEDSEEEFDD